jgi:hypothetical protein
MDLRSRLLTLVRFFCGILLPSSIILARLLLGHATPLSSTGYCFARTTPGTGISLGVLPPDRQTTMMSDTPIATNLGETLDIKVNIFSKLALNLIIMVNELSEAINLIFGKAIRLGISIDASLSQNFLAQARANTIDIL